MCLPGIHNKTFTFFQNASNVEMRETSDCMIRLKIKDMFNKIEKTIRLGYFSCNFDSIDKVQIEKKEKEETQFISYNDYFEVNEKFQTLKVSNEEFEGST